MSKTKKRLVLVDAPAIVHRAFHAIPHLTTKSGQPVNAVYGFCMIFLNMIRDLKPDFLVTAFDIKKPTFRHKAFKEYKAKRVAAPQELYDQIPKIKEIIEAFSVPVIEKAGFEADDIIGTFAAKTQKLVDEVIIVTGDLDTLQLVNPKTKVYTMKRGLTDTAIYDEDLVQERYQLPPTSLIDFKALRGDQSDNIPGVAGIGEKTGQELIEKYGSIEQIFKNLDELSPKLQKLLTGAEKQAELAKKLVTIDQNVPLEIQLAKCAFGDFDRTRIANLFQELEFRSLMTRIPGARQTSQTNLFEAAVEKTKTTPKNIPIHKTEAEYLLIVTNDQFEQICQKLSQQKGIVIDTETDRLDAISSKLLGISVSFEEKKAFYIPVDNDHGQAWLKKLKPILENPKIAKFGHNLKYDYLVLKRNGIELTPLSFDTMIASYLLNPHTRAHNLDQIAFAELGVEMIPIEDLIGKGKNLKSLTEVPTAKIAQYSGEDADITLRLVNIFKPKISEEKLDQLFYQIEMPLIKVLAEIELAGIKVDAKFLKQLSRQTSLKIEKLKAKIWKLAGEEFNISSTQQLSKILFEKLQIPLTQVKRTKTGHSTAASELEKLKGKHEIIDLIRDYREMTKLKNTYLDALPKLINPETGRLHTSFNQTITATGRLSSSEPNLQNIPIRTELGREIRKAFIASLGNKIVSADYSQIELRVMASLADDQKAIKAFKEGEDFHAATAAEIFGVGLNQVTPQQRRVAKTVNFGVLYGMSAYGLAQSLGINQKEAANFIERYFQAFAGIKKYLEEVIAETRETGFVETLSGHKRYLPEIHSGMSQVQKAAERMAINMPAQGTAAEIIKMAMIKIKSKIKEPKVKMLLQVHDELVFEVPKDQVASAAVKIREIMENVFKLDVPIKVDISVGDNWQELKKIKL